MNDNTPTFSTSVIALDRYRVILFVAGLFIGAALARRGYLRLPLL